MFFWFLILIHRCSLHWGKFGLNAFLAKWVPSRSYSTGSSPSWNRWFVHPRRRTTSHDWECFLETTVYIFFVIKLQVGNKKHLATKDLEYFWQMEQNLGTRWFKNHPILSETQLHVVALAVIWYQTCTAKNMGITMSNPSHICQASTTDLRGCIPYRLYGDGAEALRVLAFKSGLFRICSCFMLNNCFFKADMPQENRNLKCSLCSFPAARPQPRWTIEFCHMAACGQPQCQKMSN